MAPRANFCGRKEVDESMITNVRASRYLFRKRTFLLTMTMHSTFYSFELAQINCFTRVATYTDVLLLSHKLQWIVLCATCQIPIHLCEKFHVTFFYIQIFWCSEVDVKPTEHIRPKQFCSPKTSTF